MKKAARIIKKLNFKYPDIILALCSKESNSRDKPPYNSLKNAYNPHDRFKKVKVGNRIITKRDYSRPANSSYGVCQVQRNTASTNGYDGKDPKKELMDIENNLRYAGLEFIRQLRRYNGNLRKAISAYNAGRFIKSNKEYVDDVLIRAIHFKPLFSK